MFGMTIIFSRIALFNSSSCFSISISLSLISITSFFFWLASSVLPSLNSVPILSDILFLSLLKLSPCIFSSLFFLSNSSISSTIIILCSWNFFLIFSLTNSLLFLIKFISIMNVHLYMELYYKDGDFATKGNMVLQILYLRSFLRLLSSLIKFVSLFSLVILYIFSFLLINSS